MRGGVILVDGSAGNEIGSTMRRGLIAVGGDAGDFAGVSMIAGSVFVFGQPGVRPAAGMKRGTVAVFRGRPQLLRRSARTASTGQPSSASTAAVAGLGLLGREEFLNGSYRRYSGDLVALGKGEVLHWQGGSIRRVGCHPATGSQPVGHWVADSRSESATSHRLPTGLANGRPTPPGHR